eukprot:COSAG05_NODE_6164_length_1010_cov_1.294182_2_plen_29_part_01
MGDHQQALADTSTGRILTAAACMQIFHSS